MSNLQSFFEMLLKLEKDFLKRLSEIDKKIIKLKNDMEDLKGCLDDPNKFIKKQRALVYDYDIKNYDMDNIENSIKKKVGFNYETSGFQRLNAELNIVLKNYKSQKRNIRSFLNNLTKLKQCFDEELHLVKSFDDSLLEVIQSIVSQMEPKLAISALRYLNIYNTRLKRQKTSEKIETAKSGALEKIVGADKVIEASVILPVVSEEESQIINNEIIDKAKNIVSSNQELLKEITEEEQDCYQLIIDTQEYIFNIATTNNANLKVSLMILTYLINEVTTNGLTKKLETKIENVIDSYEMLKELVFQENLEKEKQQRLEEERRNNEIKNKAYEKEIIDQLLDEEKEFLESLSKYEHLFFENNKVFNAKDWNYIEALNNMNASKYLTNESSEEYQHCMYLLEASDNINLFNYLNYCKLSTILKLKATINQVAQSTKLSELISALKLLVNNYESFIAKEQNKTESNSIKNDNDNNNTIVFVSDEKQSLIEDYIFNDKTTSKNISLSHVNSVSYLINILKTNSFDFLRKNSIKAKGNNLNDEIRVFSSGNVKVAFKLSSKNYNGRIIPVVLVISAGLRLGDDNAFFEYLNATSTLTKISNFEETILPTIFDGKETEKIRQEYNFAEEKIINTLIKYVNNGHKLPNNLNIG